MTSWNGWRPNARTVTAAAVRSTASAERTGGVEAVDAELAGDDADPGSVVLVVLDVLVVLGGVVAAAPPGSVEVVVVGVVVVGAEGEVEGAASDPGGSTCWDVTGNAPSG
jgi:hypothetical protein